MKPLRVLIPIALIFIRPILAGAEAGESQDASPVIATIGDTKITEAKKGDLGGAVLGVLLEKYAAERKIAASDEEIGKLIARLEEGEKKEKARLEKRKSELTAELQADQLGKDERDTKAAELAEIEEILKIDVATAQDLTGAEEKEVAEARSGMVGAMIKAWKVNKSLFAQYGGRVIYQQMGPEPLDAYRSFLEERYQAGAFELSDKKYETDLWRIYKNDQLHDFVPEEKRAALINTPPWEREDEED